MATVIDDKPIVFHSVAFLSQLALTAVQGTNLLIFFTFS